MSTHHTKHNIGQRVKHKSFSLVVTAALFALVACGDESAAETSETADGVRSEVTLGVTDIDNTWETFVEIADRDYGIDVELVLFSDIILPNQALSNKEIDANAFQHVLYLAEFNQSHEIDLETVGVSSTTTIGLYSQDAQSPSDIPDGGQIIVANDPTNQGRSLQFLDQLGLLELDKQAGRLPSLNDIGNNPHNYEFIEIVGTQIPLSLPDADAAVIYQFSADKAGVDRELAIETDAEFIHEPEFLPYQSVFAARSEDVDDPTWKIFEQIYHSEEMIEVLDSEYDGARVHSQATLEEVQDFQHEIQDSL